MKIADCSVAFVAGLFLGCSGSTPHSAPPAQQAQTPISAAPVAAAPLEIPSSSALLEGGEVFDGKAFKLKLPAGWIVEPDPGVALVAQATKTGLYPNIKVAVLKPPAGTKVSAVVNASKEIYLKHGTVEEVVEMELQGRSVQRMLMTQNLPGNVNQQLKYFISAGTRILIFTGQAVPDAFETQLPIFEAVIRTLELIPLP